MRCPQCQTEALSGSLYCDACGHRLFAWLGDPFGALEQAGEVVGTVGPIVGLAARRPGFPWGKAAVGLLVLLLSLARSPLPTVLVAVGLIVALRRWPRMGCALFALLLFGALVLLTLFPAIPLRRFPLGSAGRFYSFDALLEALV